MWPHKQNIQCLLPGLAEAFTTHLFDRLQLIWKVRCPQQNEKKEPIL